MMIHFVAEALKIELFKTCDVLAFKPNFNLVRPFFEQFHIYTVFYGTIVKQIEKLYANSSNAL